MISHLNQKWQRLNQQKWQRLNQQAETTERNCTGRQKARAKIATAASRRSSMIAKEKQIDELVGEAESFQNDLEKLEEEGISEEQIAERMKQLEAES